MKRILSIMLAFVLIFGCTSLFATATEPHFSDVDQNEYFYTPIQWAIQGGITSGIGGNKFGPLNPCTRAQVMVFLWRAAGSPAPASTDNPFDDVNSDDYFYNAVLWAAEKKITAGVTDNSFGPNQTCTRGQIVTFLWKFRSCPEPEYPDSGFRDVATNDYYAKPVAWALENGITLGVGSGRFAPNDTCLRGQVMTFLYQTLEEKHVYEVTIVPATCIAGGCYVHICKDCGDKFISHETPALGHSWSDWVTTKKPTFEADGQKERTCQACGEKEVTSIPMLDKDESWLDEAEEVFKLVNIEREKAGVPALTYYEAGQPAVDLRCEELNTLFDHVRPNGSMCFTVFEEMGLKAFPCGENIAMGYGSPELVMDGWMHSEGHKKNILNPSAAGIVVATDGTYWVQMFVIE